MACAMLSVLPVSRVDACASDVQLRYPKATAARPLGEPRADHYDLFFGSGQAKSA